MDRNEVELQAQIAALGCIVSALIEICPDKPALAEAIKARHQHGDAGLSHLPVRDQELMLTRLELHLGRLMGDLKTGPSTE